MNTEAAQMKHEISNCIYTIRDNLLTVVLCGILGLLIGTLISLIPRPAVYQATSSLSRTTVTAQAMVPLESFQELLHTSAVLNDVLLQTSGAVSSTAELSGMLSASISATQNVMYINATHTDPLVAVKTANAAAAVMVQKAGEMAVANTGGLSVLDTAKSAGDVSNQNVWRLAYRAGGAFVFALTGCLYYAIRALTSKRLITVEDCGLNGDLEILGVIPTLKTENFTILQAIRQLFRAK